MNIAGRHEADGMGFLKQLARATSFPKRFASHGPGRNRSQASGAYPILNTTRHSAMSSTRVVNGPCLTVLQCICISCKAHLGAMKPCSTFLHLYQTSAQQTSRASGGVFPAFRSARSSTKVFGGVCLTVLQCTCIRCSCSCGRGHLGLMKPSSAFLRLHQRSAQQTSQASGGVFPAFHIATSSTRGWWWSPSDCFAMHMHRLQLQLWQGLPWDGRAAHSCISTRDPASKHLRLLVVCPRLFVVPRAQHGLLVVPV